MLKKILVLALSLWLVTSVSLFGQNRPKESVVMDKPPSMNGTPPLDIISKYLQVPPPPKYNFPFVGYTYFDFQHNDVQQRQIAYDYLGNVHFTWMDLEGPDWSYNRYIDYNAFYPNGNLLFPIGMYVTPASGRAGFGGLDILPDSREALFYGQWGNGWNTTLAIEKNIPGHGSFNQFDVPDWVNGSWVAGTWPSAACAKLMVADTNFIHVTCQEGLTAGGSYRHVGYVRCFEKPGNHDILVCQSPNFLTTEIPHNTKLVSNRTIYNFATALFGGSVIATSPISHKVAIVWLQNAGSNWRCNEVKYLESTNNGSDWMATGNMGTPHQVTNYSLDCNTSAMYDIAAVYDYKDILHIMWTTTVYNNWGEVTLWHWSQQSGEIKPVNSAHSWYRYPTYTGAWNMLIAKMTMGVTTKDSNYLYCVYTEFNDNDRSDLGWGNGDLFAQASSNRGLSWGPEMNLTNTNTNGCAPPACSSEHWASVAERVDDSLRIQYIEDFDAGGAAYSGYQEGYFTLNQISYLSIPRPLAPPVPMLWIHPTQLTSPIEWAKNHSSTTDTLTVDNVGTTTLQVQLSGPAWLSLSPASFNIIEAGPTQPVVVTLSGAGKADTFLTGEIKILSNSGVVGGGPNFNDTEYVDVNFAVTDTFFIAEFDTCKRGPYLVVSNVGNLGAQSTSAGMFYNGLNYLFDGSPVMVTDQSPAYTGTNKGYSWIIYKNDFLPEGHLVKTDYPSLKATTYVEKCALNNWRISADTNFNAHWAWLGWTKWSKIIQFDWVPGGLHAVLIKNWWVPGLPPKWWMDVSSTAPVGGYFGLAGDWNVTASFSVKDKGGIIDSLNLVYLYQDTVSSNKWYGGYQMLGAYVTKGTTTNYTTPFAMHIGNNATQMYSFGGYDDDSLWKYMSMPGDYIEQDSAQDMNVILSAVEMLNPDASTEIGMTYAAIVSDSNLVDFVRQANTLKKEFQKPGSEPIFRFLYGDANQDAKVTVSDVVHLVNYLFKGGPEPWLLLSDCNNDWKVTISDVIYLVNYLFKGGPTPVTPDAFAKPF